MKNSGKDLLAATTLMATSAIGPGFLTQTTVFTAQLAYNFGFAILISVVIDIVAQVTIWKTLTYAGIPVQQLADSLLKGLGRFLIIPIAFGGLVFNVGNLAGAGMGLNAMSGMPLTQGMLISCGIVGLIFYSDNFLPKLDIFIKAMAVVMVLLLVAMVFLADIDFLRAFRFTLLPEKVDIRATITLVGGTVGGYITFAGVQRLLDAGITDSRQVGKSAYRGILFTGIFRYFLFIGVLSPVLAGLVLNPENPTASVFSDYFGEWGGVLFGVMIWAASITSVIGATYTSLAFLKDLHPGFGKYRKAGALVFIAISLSINVFFGKPVTLLVFAGYLNAFILPLGLVVVLLSVVTHKALKGVPLSKGLQAAAWAVTLLLLYFSIRSLF